MRKTLYLQAAVALLAAAGCARSDGIVAPERNSTGRANNGGTTPTTTNTAQGDTVTRGGNGLIGSGG